MSNRNITVHSNLESADATTAIEMVLFDLNGAAVTLAADERLVFSYVQASGIAAGNIIVFCDADDDNAVDAGEEVLVGRGIAAFPFSSQGLYGNSPWRGQLGAKPHLIADAVGAVEASFIARVIGDEYG